MFLREIKHTCHSITYIQLIKAKIQRAIVLAFARMTFELIAQPKWNAQL
jgi:hypothetical protein